MAAEDGKLMRNKLEQKTVSRRRNPKKTVTEFMSDRCP